jgi:hypothetical protein
MKTSLRRWAILSGGSIALVACAAASAPTVQPIATSSNASSIAAPQSLPAPASDAGVAMATLAACPSSWTVAPAVDPSISVPDGGAVLLHAAANGTQNYTCTAQTIDGGTSYAWVFVGPEATLADCNGAPIGQHFASDAGATAPEWQTNDGAFVIGKKLAAFAATRTGALLWLLLQATSHGGTGTLSNVGYVQRLDTTGGAEPSKPCDATNAGATEKVSYTADYYFFGP